MSDTLTRRLESLFARVALNMAPQNAYEQLRNLGFLRRGGSRVLPVSDVNINPDPGKRRVTSVFGEMRRSKIDGQR